MVEADGSGSGSEEEVCNVMVIDNGAYMIKAGRADCNYPTANIQPLVGRPSKYGAIYMQSAQA